MQNYLEPENTYVPKIHVMVPECQEPITLGVQRLPQAMGIFYTVYQGIECKT